MVLAGCASGPASHSKQGSVALEAPGNTTAGAFFAPELEANPGKSGFILLPSGDEAFRTRNGIAAIAEKTIDAQYYIWEADTTGRLLIDRLLRAADRGVRVRLLLDDYLTEGKDLGIALVDSHPNVEVRLFNPFSNRGVRGIDFLTNFARVNHRMHNKVFIADNAIAVVGGRNIGDGYFGVDPAANFRDLDMVTVGPVVAEVSKSFDLFWNSEWAVPIRAVADIAVEDELRQDRLERLRDWAEAAEQDFPFEIFVARAQRIERMGLVRNRLLWAAAEVLFDDPDKARKAARFGILPRLRRQLDDMAEELLIESAYFIPGRAGVSLLGALESRGVEVRVLTNSLASNDVPPAFSGYAPYRAPLLGYDVELYELSADPNSARRYWPSSSADSRATLHTKTLVFDRESVFVGSMNLDPRSREINTEIGILVHSPELAGQVADFIELGMRPDNSYRLALNKSRSEDEGPLLWINAEDGRTIRHTSEPESDTGNEVAAWFMSLLPIEDQL